MIPPFESIAHIFAISPRYRLVVLNHVTIIIDDAEVATLSDLQGAVVRVAVSSGDGSCEDGGEEEGEDESGESCEMRFELRGG